MPTPDEIAPAVTSCQGGVRIRVRVQPRASRNGISGIMDGALRIAVQAPPVDGKANAFLCELLAKWLELPKSACSVVSGETARNKTVAAAGVDCSTVCTRLASVKK